jgi:3-methyl-2-oxobutanoate hydroxymethyltransferase
MPQVARAEGGYKVKGKDEADTVRLIRDAGAIEAAGALAIVVEGVKADAAKKITESVGIPIIGIGAGVNCDAQVLVWSDMLGFFEEFTPKFVRKYMDGAALAKSAFEKFANDVKNGDFPNEKESY